MTEATRATGTDDSLIVVNNSLILLARRTALWVFGGILVLFLPRYLGDEGLGQLAFAQSFVALFVTLLSLGFGRFLIKAVARDRSAINRYLGSALVLRGAMALVVAAIVIVIAQVVGDSRAAKQVMYVLAAAAVIRSFTWLVTSILSGMENMGWPATAEVASRFVVIAVGIPVLVQGQGVVAYAFVLLAAAGVNLILNALYIARKFPVGLSFGPSRMKALVIGSAPFILMGFVLNVYDQTDTVILRLFTSEAVVGWYAAANQIYHTVGVLPMAFTAALLPTLSRVHAAGAGPSIVMAKKSLAVVAVVIVPLALGLGLFSDAIIVTLPYPEVFQNSAPLLTILACTIPITAFLTILGTIAVAVDRQKAWAMGLLATVCFNIALNALAAPYFQEHYGNGGIGVALTTLISEFFMVSLGVRLMPKGVVDRAMLVMLVKVGASAAAAAAAVLLCTALGLGTAPAAAIGALTYGAMALFTRALAPDDLRFIHQAVVQTIRPARRWPVR